MSKNFKKFDTLTNYENTVTTPGIVSLTLRIVLPTNETKHQYLYQHGETKNKAQTRKVKQLFGFSWLKSQFKISQVAQL